jgi:hypothetical protein
VGAIVRLHTFQGDDVKQILDYAALQRQLENDFAKCGNWPKETVAKAENDFNSVVKKHAEQRRKVYEKREKAKFTLFRERGLQLLLRAALVLDRLENKEDTISFGLEQRIHRGFKLLLKRKYPFTSLMKILDLQTIDQYSYISGDDFSSKSDESLKAYYHSLREQIEEILNAIVVATMEK